MFYNLKEELYLKRLFIFCFILLNNLSFYAFSNTIFYVSTLGNDSWFGKLPTPNSARSDGPFASLEKARDPVKATGKTPGKDLYIGLYRFRHKKSPDNL